MGRGGKKVQEVRIRFSMTNGQAIEMTVADEGLVEKYKAVASDGPMFILVDNDGRFYAALNPRHLVSVTRV